MKRLIAAAVPAVAVFGILLLWLTPYRHTKLAGLPVRIHRITGHTEVLHPFPAPAATRRLSGETVFCWVSATARPSVEHAAIDTAGLTSQEIVDAHAERLRLRREEEAAIEHERRGVAQEEDAKPSALAGVPPPSEIEDIPHGLKAFRAASRKPEKPKSRGFAPAFE